MSTFKSFSCTSCVFLVLELRPRVPEVARALTVAFMSDDMFGPRRSFDSFRSSTYSPITVANLNCPGGPYHFYSTNFKVVDLTGPHRFSDARISVTQPEHAGKCTVASPPYNHTHRGAVSILSLDDSDSFQFASCLRI